ncbi:hypothetical protein LTR94_030528, partial [Friedmanniomyces endolithicus]
MGAHGLVQLDHALGGAHLRYDLGRPVRNGVEPGGDLFGCVLADDEVALGQGDIGALEPAGAGGQDGA